MHGMASVWRGAMMVAALTLAALPQPALAGDQASAGQESADEADAPLLIHFVDNFTQDFAVPPDFLWEELKRMYLAGNKYRDLGFDVEALAPTPEAPLGGTIVSRTDDGVLDSRKALFTKVDDENRFLALRAIYETGINIQVSYDVRPTPGGSLMQLIVHATQPMPTTDRDPDAETVRAEAERLTVFHYDQLVDMWAAEARRVEALYRETTAAR